MIEEQNIFQTLVQNNGFNCEELAGETVLNAIVQLLPFENI
jgi:hypothetical protein